MSGSNISNDRKSADSEYFKVVSVLSAFLVTQLALSAFLSCKGNLYQAEPVSAKANLLTCNFDSIDEIVNEERDSNGKTVKLVLQRDKTTWRLPQYYSCPASNKKVADLLKSWQMLRRGLPVTTTAEAAERFKLDPDNFQHATSFFSGGKTVAVVYSGESSSFRTDYVRVSGKNEIYSLEIPRDLISVNSFDWVDKQMLSPAPASIMAVEYPTFAVRRLHDRWVLIEHGREHSISKEVVGGLTFKLGHISFDAVLSKESLAKYNAANAEFSYRVTNNEGAVTSYSFRKGQDGKFWVLKPSNEPYFFQVGEWLVKELHAVTAESLLVDEAQHEKMQNLSGGLQKENAPELVSPSQPSLEKK